MNNRFLAVVILVVLLQVPASDCFGAMGSLLGSIPTSYPASNDPGLKAADSSEEAVRKSKESREAAEKALSKENLAKRPPDYTEIDKAINHNQIYKLTKAAMLRAEGKISQAQDLEAEAYGFAGSSWIAGPLANQVYHSFYANELEKVAKNMPSSGNASRVQEEFCAQVRAAWRHGEEFQFPYEPGMFFRPPGDRNDGGACGRRADYFQPLTR